MSAVVAGAAPHRYDGNHNASETVARKRTFGRASSQSVHTGFIKRPRLPPKAVTAPAARSMLNISPHAAALCRSDSRCSAPSPAASPVSPLTASPWSPSHSVSSTPPHIFVMDGAGSSANFSHASFERDCVAEIEAKSGLDHPQREARSFWECAESMCPVCEIQLVPLACNFGTVLFCCSQVRDARTSCLDLVWWGVGLLRRVVSCRVLVHSVLLLRPGSVAPCDPSLLPCACTHPLLGSDRLESLQSADTSYMVWSSCACRAAPAWR